MLPGCEKEMTILANNVSVAGAGNQQVWKATLYLGCTEDLLSLASNEVLLGLRDLRAVKRCSGAWSALRGFHQHRSEGQRQAGQQAQSRCKHTAVPRHQGLCAFLSRRRLGEEGESVATFPWAFPLCLVSWFFFFFFWPPVPSLLV